MNTLTHNTFHRYNIIEMVTKVKKTLEDSNIVKLELQDMDWKKFVTNYQVGMKKFILKGNSESRFSVVNIFIHSCIYSYHASKVIKFYLSKWIAITLTLHQAIQMFWGKVIIISAYYYVQVAQVQSNVMTFNLKLLAMYLNYLVSFINIFKQNCKMN